MESVNTINSSEKLQALQTVILHCNEEIEREFFVRPAPSFFSLLQPGSELGKALKKFIIENKIKSHANNFLKNSL